MANALIFNIQRYSIHDGPGIRTTVFLKGCPLKCVWCHNPEGISFQHQTAYLAHKCISCGECVTACPAGCHSAANGVHTFHRENCTACGICSKICFGEAMLHYGEEKTVEELMPLLLEDRVFYGDTGGVTLSGGECLMQADFCAELLKQLKENGVHTAVDTCGFVSRDAIDKVMPYTDVFLYDLKAYDEDVHIKCTGHSNKMILENLKYIDRCGKQIEIRLPFVPGFNSEQIEAMASFMSGVKNLTKVRILPYHNYAGNKYKSLGMRDTLPETMPDEKDIEEAMIFLKTYGIVVM
jgi:pyruvate formate lyase activating enzyme